MQYMKHHDKTGFNPEIKVWLNIKNSTKVIQNINPKKKTIFPNKRKNGYLNRCKNII